MDEVEWIARCAGRLQAQWPRADRDALVDAAAELCAETRWRRLAPEVAAVAWLRLGVLAPDLPLTARGDDDAAEPVRRAA
ncbi:hypothetical protein [Aquabacterium sp. J223]|uniref:hypothetical protein n=1 Tax=Aquabacterium sp. J223 TaxID=2898431 RepID=UPI0021AD5942|nr:hypothetical protein [Aquabacterium sp. J223]UUX94448.1 hypothetical protein LRS07_14140 [Aquabacterium sp. J223]